MLRHTSHTNINLPIFKLLKISSFTTRSSSRFFLVKFTISLFKINITRHNENKKKKRLEQNFPNWPSRGNFLPYFHRNRFDRQLVDIFSRKISLPRDAWTGTERGGDRTLWSVRRMLHNFDGIYRLRGVAMRFHFLNDIFSRHLFLLLRLLFSSEGKKEKKKGEIRYYRTNNKTCSALYYAWRENLLKGDCWVTFAQIGYSGCQKFVEYLFSKIYLAKRIFEKNYFVSCR